MFDRSVVCPCQLRRRVFKCTHLSLLLKEASGACDGLSRDAADSLSSV